MPTFVQSVGSSLSIGGSTGQRSVNGQRTNRGTHVMYLLTASTPSLKLSREKTCLAHGPRGMGGTQLEGRGAGAKTQSVTLDKPQRKHGHMITGY
ncbi:hypothetical protein BGY98DRAFT_1014359 [Russula aff. rugulosa BPL654]|nr:hypothetical protein BGY98DRAFT_1014359 [Russula aff. rugulosa BPL654]